MTDSQIWLTAALILFIAEIITPGFVLANFAVASLASAAAAYFGADLTMQIIVFCVAALASFFTIRPILRRTFLKDSAEIPTNVSALSGRVAVVTEAIPAAPRVGRVQLDGDSWAAMSDSGQPIEADSVVTVVAVDSTILRVTQKV